MCVTFANAGHTIEHLAERTNQGDTYDVLFDGLPADLKRTKSHNHIKDYAIHAVRHQGAQIVLFQFDKMDRKIFGKIKDLKRIGIKGFYFVTGYESDVYSF